MPFLKPQLWGWGGSIKVCLSFSAAGTGRLVRIQDRMNSAKYKDVFEENLLQHISDLKNTAKTMLEWFWDKYLIVLEWPNQSPILSLLEHLWRNLKSHFINRKNGINCPILGVRSSEKFPYHEVKVYRVAETCRFPKTSGHLVLFIQSSCGCSWGNILYHNMGVGSLLSPRSFLRDVLKLSFGFATHQSLGSYCVQKNQRGKKMGKAVVEETW